MSEMEKEVKDFLKKILLTMSVGMLWLLINSTAGIMYGYFFIEGKLSNGNIIFYLWLVLSFIFLLRYFIKLWKKPFPVE